MLLQGLYMMQSNILWDVIILNIHAPTEAKVIKLVLHDGITRNYILCLCTWCRLVFFTVSRATLCSIKFIKSYALYKFITIRFDQFGHHQVWKLLGEKTSVFCCCLCCLSPLDALVCLSWWVVFSPVVCCVVTGCYNIILLLLYSSPHYEIRQDGMWSIWERRQIHTDNWSERLKWRPKSRCKNSFGISCKPVRRTHLASHIS
jgi:hypothetical protein